MKRRIVIITALLLCMSPLALAQTDDAIYAQDPPLEYYEGELTPSVVTGRGKRKTMKDRREWRKQYRLVYNFNRVYPYALVGRKMMAQVDSTIAAENLGELARANYINRVEKELFRLFEQDIRHMTISMGVVLIKLVDRECGVTMYEIIRDYEGSFAAGFWNLVGKMFDQDLKSHYDPTGADANIEELVRIWDSGSWDEFYFEIFGKMPEKVVIVSETLSTTARRK